MKKILTVFALTLGLTSLAGPALAEDAAPAPEAVTAPADPVVAEDPAPVVAEDPAPVAGPVAVPEEGPAPAPEEPVAETPVKTTHPPKFEKYEVEVCWTMDESDGVEGTYEWPQTRSGTCAPEPKCGEVIEIQRDLYWIEDKKDEKYLAGLTVLNSPADDASLSPHGYYSKVFTGPACDVEIPVPAALPVKDECGVGNASWAYSGDTSNDFSWDLTDDGSLSAHAHDGFVFEGGGKVIEFGKAPETNTEACPTTEEPPVPPEEPETPVEKPKTVTTVSDDTPLPDTGGAPLGLLAVGAVLVACGSLLVGRRKA